MTYTGKRRIIKALEYWEHLITRAGKFVLKHGLIRIPKKSKDTFILKHQNRHFVKETLRILSKTRRNIFFQTAIWALIFITSCSTPDTNPVDSYSYFPLEIGNYRVYDVTEDVYSAGQKNPVSKAWKEKDEVMREEQSANNSKRYILSRSIWDEQSQSWIKKKEFSVSTFPDKMVVNLDNEVFTPLIFPCNPGVEWDGYAYFNLDSKDPRYGSMHRYEDINKPLTSNSLHFDYTVKVSERADTTSRAQFRLGYKYYASGVGLIVDEQTDLDYLQENGEFIGYRTIASGKRTIKRIAEYGVSK